MRHHHVNIMDHQDPIVLQSQSNQILTAVVQGARKEEQE